MILKNRISLLFSSRSYALIMLSLLLISLSCAGKGTDTTEYFTANTLRFEDRTYVENIKTVQLSSDPQILAPPIIKLNTDNKLYFSFDDLDGDYKDYSYTLIHCTAKWEPSNVMTSEYMDGFAVNPIHEYRFARTTLQHYTHYSVVLPDDGMTLLKSGNYLLKVFTDNDEEKLVITKRFMVVDNKVTIDMNVHAATIVADRNFKQEVDFTITYSNGEINNPFAEITPVILQNYNWGTAINGLEPQFVREQQLTYDYDDVNVFRGGSEFRWFDTRTLRLQTERVQSISKDSTNHYQVYLLPDERRTYKRYVNSNDIDGKYLVKTQDGNNSDVDAEYCYVHFFLPWDPQVTEGNLYVYGALTDWQCKAQNRLQYNAELKGYEVTLYLKQGYYNYEYVLLRDNGKAPDEQFVEGMHQETENDYTILVYFRRQGSWIDEIVGLKTINSRQ